MSKRSSFTQVFTVFAAHCAIVVLTGACAGADDRSAPVSDSLADNGETDAGAYTVDRCLFQAEGCACGEEHAKLDCGRVYRRSGDYVSCIVGHRECLNGAWSACSVEVVVDVDPNQVPPSYAAAAAEGEADAGL